MIKFTREALEALWAAQERREAERRELLRKSVAESDAPLPDELAESIIDLNDRDTRSILSRDRA